MGHAQAPGLLEAILSQYAHEKKISNIYLNKKHNTAKLVLNIHTFWNFNPKLFSVNHRLSSSKPLTATKPQPRHSPQQTKSSRHPSSRR